VKSLSLLGATSLCGIIAKIIQGVIFKFYDCCVLFVVGMDCIVVANICVCPASSMCIGLSTDCVCMSVCVDFFLSLVIRFWYYHVLGARGSIVVEALCYKPEVTALCPDEVDFF
jgi:hypothetical protein